MIALAAETHVEDQIRVADMLIDDTVIESDKYWSVIDPVTHSANTEEGRDAYDASLARFSRPQRLVHAVFWYLTETRNGGHTQFFRNSWGTVWEDALAGFREIGASQSALILSGAALRVGGFPPLDWHRRQNLLRTLNPKFSDLDDRFQANDPVPALRDYILANRDAFYFRGMNLR